MYRWRIGCLIWTDDDLMGSALRESVQAASEEVHEAMAKELLQTVGDNRLAAQVTDDEIPAATETFLADPNAKRNLSHRC